MADAAVLCTSDHQGNPLWHPTSLADIDAVGARVWELWRAMQAGLASRGDPYGWWRIRGIPTSHQYEVGPLGPGTVARCGMERPADADLVKDPTPPLCSVCSGADGREAQSPGWGRIGDVVLGPDGHPMR